VNDESAASIASVARIGNSAAYRDQRADDRDLRAPATTEVAKVGAQLGQPARE